MFFCLNAIVDLCSFTFDDARLNYPPLWREVMITWCYTLFRGLCIFSLKGHTRIVHHGQLPKQTSLCDIASIFAMFETQNVGFSLQKVISK